MITALVAGIGAWFILPSLLSAGMSCTGQLIQAKEVERMARIREEYYKKHRDLNLYKIMVG